jgi:phosphatidylserine/phosphatidylglycerophosphate/cardiolipin synthase-like enzyme
VSRAFVALAVCALVVPAAPVAGVTAATAAPEIIAVHPNPVADGDAGEYIVVHAPPNATLSDGEDTTSVSGTAVLSSDPAAARNLTDRRPVLDASLALANGGETLTLARDGRTLNTVTYEDAPEGETLRNGTWRAPGATEFDPLPVRNVPTHTFVLTDSPGPPLELLRSAERRLLVGAYTLTSERATAALVAAAERGVDVRVLVEGGPVGGVTRRQARRLDALAAAGVEVRAVSGPTVRLRFHHAKYAVADDRAFVTSENWKRSGIGGGGTRGWGAVVESPRVADRLAAAFQADSDGRNSVGWGKHRRNETFVTENRTGESFPSRFAPVRTSTNATLLLAPDNAEAEIRDLLGSADRTLRVELASLSRTSPLYDGLIAAAERGVDVRVALNGAWYSREENRRVVRALNARAANGSLPLEAKLVEPRSRFSAVHVKGVIADGERALVGSLNWNQRFGPRKPRSRARHLGRAGRPPLSAGLSRGLARRCVARPAHGAPPRRALRRARGCGPPKKDGLRVSYRFGPAWRSSSSSASAIFATSASRTASRIPGTNLMEPTTRWPPPWTPPPSISSWSSATISGMSRRTPSERSTAKSGP